MMTRGTPTDPTNRFSIKFACWISIPALFRWKMELKLHWRARVCRTARAAECCIGGISLVVGVKRLAFTEGAFSLSWDVECKVYSYVSVVRWAQSVTYSTLIENEDCPTTSLGVKFVHSLLVESSIVAHCQQSEKKHSFPKTAFVCAVARMWFENSTCKK
jgi:hypothetical protein